MSNDEQQLNTTFDGKQFQDVPQEIVDRANRDGSEYLISEWARKGGPYPPIDGPYIPNTMQRIKNFIKSIFS